MNWEGPQPTETKDDAEDRRDFWSIQDDFICRHHTEPRFQPHVPKEETFQYIDVTRSTHTDLDVLEEIRIDDYWNVDCDLQGRKNNCASSKTLVGGGCRDRPSRSLLLTCPNVKN